MMWHARDNTEPAKVWLRGLIAELGARARRPGARRHAVEKRSTAPTGTPSLACARARGLPAPTAGAYA